MKTIRIGDVQNSLVRLILWQARREPITDGHLTLARNFFNNKCAYCGEQNNLHFDHAVPINKTSLGQHRVGNLIPSCSDCNQRKGKKDFREYLRERLDGDQKIAKILAYMEAQNYVPLDDEKEVKEVKEVLDEARKELADVAEKYIKMTDNLLLSTAPPVTSLPPRAMSTARRLHPIAGQPTQTVQIKLQPAYPALIGISNRSKQLKSG
jgi:HNH endonuclease